MDRHSVTIHDKQFRLLMTSSEIATIVDQLARELRDQYQEKDPICLVILKGAFMFANDLIRAMGIPCEVAFLKAQSYGAQMHSSGKVDIQFFSDPNRIGDRHILIIEDIVDTGLTLQHIHHYLQQFRPLSVETVTLLLKPDTFIGTPPRYIGKAIAPLFVIGYGMDYNEGGRYLPDIYVLDQEAEEQIQQVNEHTAQ